MVRRRMTSATCLTCDWTVSSAGGGGGDKNLLDLRLGQTRESLQVQSRNTQDLPEGLQWSWREEGYHGNMSSAVTYLVTKTSWIQVV